MKLPICGVREDFSSRAQKNQSDFSILKCIFLVFAGLILFASIITEAAANEPDSNCGCTSTGQSLHLQQGKLINCSDIMKGFEEGQERVKVIVNLAEPAETKAKTDWRSKQSLKILQDEIKAIQTPLLSALSEGEFKLRRRFDNQAGFSGEVTLAGLEKLKNDPRVVSIEPVYLLEPHIRQGIARINADTYRSSYNGQNIAIAICDTGIDYSHPMLGNGGFPNDKVIGGYDYGDNDADPMPNSAQPHGTCCAGIAAGDLGNVGDYIGGVAYNAKLYALKITAGSGGTASSDDMVAAWNWCITHKDDDPAHPILVISTSFGGERHYSACDSDTPSMTQAANNAVAAGITVVASSGNDGYCDSIAWPACISSVISVGAVYDAAFGTYQPCVNAASCATKYASGGCSTGYYAIDNTYADMVASYSNTASFLTVLAPSNQCYTTDIVGSSGYSSGDYYSSFGGTSAASPYTAGAVACLQSAAKALSGSYLSPSEIRTILISTGDNITDGKVAITKPRVNLEQAINNLLAGGSPPTANDDNVITSLNTPITIALAATDDGLPNPPGALSYTITSLPGSGSLTDPNAGSITAVPYTLASNGNSVIYTPQADYAGTDNFTFKANDGGEPPAGGDSNQANISINITFSAAATLLTEGFESAFVNGAPVGWTKAYMTSDVDWTRNIGDSRTTDTAYGGTYNAMLYYAGIGNHETYLITPAINLAGATNAVLEFWHKQVKEPPNTDTLYVYYKTSASGSWTQLASYTSSVSDWTKRTISLPNPSSTYYIGFLGNAKGGYGVCIDDVNITATAQFRTLTISSTQGGSTEPNQGNHLYSSGAVVEINAIPAPNYHFVNWTGSGVNAGKVADANSANTTITMDGSYAVVANFAPNGIKIFGFITEPDVNIPAEGVTVNASSGGSDTTDANGYYELTLAPGWSGTITPSKTGWTFEPNSITYDNITADHNDSYIVAMDTFIIAGFIADSNLLPLDGVSVSPDNNGGQWTSKYLGGGSDSTDANGYYEAVVDYNWSGKITPSKYAYIFEPNSIQYVDVVSDYNQQNYIGTLLRFTISGYIKNSCNVPLASVVVAANNGGGSCLTDVAGFYEVWVDYNWFGAITPSKTHWTFDPNSREYAGILDNLTEQNYLAGNTYDLDCDGSIGLSDIGVFSSDWLSIGENIPADFDGSGTVDFLDFAVFADVWLEN